VFTFNASASERQCTLGTDYIVVEIDVRDQHIHFQDCNKRGSAFYIDARLLQINAMCLVQRSNVCDKRLDIVFRFAV
jgi:hypothetical protein